MSWPLSLQVAWPLILQLSWPLTLQVSWPLTLQVSCRLHSHVCCYQFFPRLLFPWSLQEPPLFSYFGAFLSSLLLMSLAFQEFRTS